MKFNKSYLFIGIVLFIAAFLGVYFLGNKSTRTQFAEQTTIVNQPGPTSSEVVTNPTQQTIRIQKPSLSPNPAAHWKTFSRPYLNFQYPSDWTINTVDYLNTIEISNANHTVLIRLSEGQYPFGFENPNTKMEYKDLVVTVNGKPYAVKEVIVNSSSAFVNFAIGSTQDHRVLFGSGYPTSGDQNASLSDYEKEKATILKILETINFSR